MREWVDCRNRIVRADRPIPNMNGGLEARLPAVRQISVTQLEFLGDRLIAVQVLALQVIQQTAALADHH